MLSIAIFAGMLVILVLLGLYGLGRCVWDIRHGRLGRAGVRGILSSLIIAAATLLGLGVLNLSTYQQLIYEQPVARISFHSERSSVFVAQLILANGSSHAYVLNGQDWELQAQVLKWRNWLEVIGLHSRYRLTRLTGRYADILMAREAPHTVYALVPSRGFDLWARAGWLRHALVDAFYGSAVYLPMANGAEYDIRLGRTGLIARPINAAARQAVNGWR